MSSTTERTRQWPGPCRSRPGSRWTPPGRQPGKSSLKEAQFYLDVPEGGLGERVAAGLRELLRDPARGPVLVLATLWPRFWDTLTARPDDGADAHAQARELLAGHDITVPEAFTAAQVAGLAGAGDARLVLAGKSAQGGQVVQFLAGAPELEARYRHAPPGARAVIEAAMEGYSQDKPETRSRKRFPWSAGGACESSGGLPRGWSRASEKTRSLKPTPL